MEPGRLLHHGQAQAAAVLAPGGVPDGQHGPLAPPAQIHPHMAVGLPIAIGVGDQVRQQPGQPGHVPVYQQVRLGMHRQRGAPRGQMGLLLTEDLHQLAQVRRFQLELLRTLLQPGDVQQLTDEPGHLLPLAADHVHGLAIVLLRGLSVVQTGQDHRHRRPQLMRGVGGELPLRLEGPLQPVGVAGHHGHHLGRRRLGDLVVVHEHHEHQHQGGNDHHHHGKPDSHADLDGDMSHTPSFSTQPMPRTVCSSFFSWPPSSFLRR